MSPKSDRFSQKDDKFSLWQTLQSEEQSRTGCGYISRSYLQRNDEETYDGQADKLQTVELLSLTVYRDDLKKNLFSVYLQFNDNYWDGRHCHLQSYPEGDAGLWLAVWQILN